jgi:hypothetical protein
MCLQSQRQKHSVNNRRSREPKGDLSLVKVINRSPYVERSMCCNLCAVTVWIYAVCYVIAHAILHPTLADSSTPPPVSVEEVAGVAA